jgi:hypothetical protein
MSAAPRSRAQRRRDTEHAGRAARRRGHEQPSTSQSKASGRNLTATRTVRLGLGHTRDVSMIEGEVEVLEIDALPGAR